MSREQAQMLASLAVACRPYRAPTWDEAGVLANIGKVKDRPLAEVALAVIRAAADYECKSPGVIPTNGSHWQEQLKPAKWAPELLEPSERCGICGKSDIACRANPRSGHDFRPDYRPERDVDISPTITELKGHLEPMKTPSAPREAQSQEESA